MPSLACSVSFHVIKFFFSDSLLWLGAEKVQFLILNYASSQNCNRDSHAFLIQQEIQNQCVEIMT